MPTLRFTSIRRKNSGYALIILLVIIGLGVLVFVLQKTGVLARGPKDPNAEGIMPWAECKIREAKQEQSSSAEQPQINPMQFDGSVWAAGSRGEPRGEIEIYLSGESVGGSWGGGYHGSDNKQYDITGSEFSGKFYPDKKYVDPNGNEDGSKRYFLCKGNFQMQQTGEQFVAVLTGEIYVRGWVGEDKIVSGNVFITSNHKDYKEFEFRGRTQ